MANHRLSSDDLRDLEHKNMQMFELIRRMRADEPETAATLSFLAAWSQITNQAIASARQYADQGEIHFSEAWRLIAGYCIGQSQPLSEEVRQAIDRGVHVVNQWDYDPDAIKS